MSFEEILYREANKSPMHKKYVCAIFDKKNNLISKGHNEYLCCGDRDNPQCLLRV